MSSTSLICSSPMTITLVQITSMTHQASIKVFIETFIETSASTFAFPTYILPKIPSEHFNMHKHTKKKPLFLCFNPAVTLITFQTKSKLLPDLQGHFWLMSPVQLHPRPHFLMLTVIL